MRNKRQSQGERCNYNYLIQSNLYFQSMLVFIYNIIYNIDPRNNQRLTLSGVIAFYSILDIDVERVYWIHIFSL